MKSLILLTLTLAMSPLFADEDIRSKVKNGTHNISSTIDPGKHIYGHAFGSSEDDFIKAEGKPSGYIRLTALKTVLVYGESHGYIFTDGKLSGLRISSSIIDWKLANQMPYQQKHNDQDWKLSNGIMTEMTDKAVADIVGDKLKTENHNTFFMQGGCRVELSFATYSSGEEKGVKKICGIYIQKQ